MIVANDRLAEHYKFIEEYIPDEGERLKFSLALFVISQSDMKRLFVMAREECGLPKSWVEWVEDGRPKGDWQTWNFTKGLCKNLSGFDHKLGLRDIEKLHKSAGFSSRKR